MDTQKKDLKPFEYCRPIAVTSIQSCGTMPRRKRLTENHEHLHQHNGDEQSVDHDVPQALRISNHQSQTNQIKQLKGLNSLLRSPLSK